MAIVEDEQSIREKLREYIGRYGRDANLEFQVHLFRDGVEILRLYEPKYDIILLDIEMPEVDGMTAAEKIREKDQDTVLMFITNMAKYAIRGYSVGALDFVMKPVNYQTFRMRFQRAVERAGQRRDTEIVLTRKDGIERIPIRSIYYIEVQNRMLHYHTERGVVQVRDTMQNAEEKMKQYHFSKCNHWYLVNLRHVQKISKNIVVVAGEELEISRRTKTQFLNDLTDYMGGNI